MSIDFYKEFGELGYLANYSNHSFFDNGIFYKTVEHYYQSHKFDDEKLINKILACDTPKEASNIGRDRNNKKKDDFDKLSVMYQGLYLKFSQNKDIRSKLIETRNKTIREMSVKESYWGVGPNLDGENHIGKLLMQVRDNIKKDLLNEIIDKCKNKKVYVIGHSNPDIDSIFSAYLLTKILKKYKVDAVFSLRDENIINKELISLLDEDYEVINDYNNKYFVLVDHNNLNSIKSENVIGAIDHHRITGEVEDLIEIEYASTALLIYDLFKDNYKFTKKDKKLIALTVVLDTDFLLSTRFSDEDRKLYNELNINLNINNLKKKHLIITDFNKDINYNLYEDYKEYNYNGKSIKRSTIKSYTKEKDEYINEYLKEISNYNINLMIWCDYEAEKTYICFNNSIIEHPFFTTSTNLVLDYLNKEKYL